MKDKQKTITIWTVVILVLTLIAWSVVFGLVAAFLGFPAFITGAISFVVIYVFMTSPLYHTYLDWVEDRVSERVK